MIGVVDVPQHEAEIECQSEQDKKTEDDFFQIHSKPFPRYCSYGVIS
jgi:hypothetical protein